MTLPWVRDAVHRLVGFTPYPGTLNVRLDADMAAAWARIEDGPALALPLPPGQTCGARLFPVILAPDVEAAVIVPEVTSHGKNLLELIAPIPVRSRLGLADDDRVTILIHARETNGPQSAS